MNVESNILRYIDGDQKSGDVKPTERYASFDYCFNYFQSFKESGIVKDISHEKNMQESCLQLGFYLASWGMFRGSSTLLQKSLKIFEPVISVIASTDADVWDIDADCYTLGNIEKIIEFEKKIERKLPKKFSFYGNLLGKILPFCPPPGYFADNTGVDFFSFTMNQSVNIIIVLRHADYYSVFQNFKPFDGYSSIF